MGPPSCRSQTGAPRRRAQGTRQQTKRMSQRPLPFRFGEWDIASPSERWRTRPPPRVGWSPNRCGRLRFATVRAGAERGGGLKLRPPPLHVRRDRSGTSCAKGSRRRPGPPADPQRQGRPSMPRGRRLRRGRGAGCARSAGESRRSGSPRPRRADRRALGLPGSLPSQYPHPIPLPPLPSAAANFCHRQRLNCDHHRRLDRNSRLRRRRRDKRHIHTHGGLGGPDWTAVPPVPRPPGGHRSGPGWGIAPLQDKEAVLRRCYYERLARASSTR